MNQNLVINQHVFPSKSIGRFCDQTGNVQVFRIKSKNLFLAKPENKIFCVQQVWDQSSEQGYGKKIEDKFQKLVGHILSKKSAQLPLEGNRIVTEFYALWCFRSNIQSYDNLAEGNLVGVKCNSLTDEQKKNIELRHAIYIEEGGVIPKRFKRGLTIQVSIDSFYLRNSGLKWTICHSNELDLLVSDNPNGEFIVPITKSMCLICGLDVTSINKQQAMELNLNAIKRSKEYYFSNKLSACVSV